MKGNPEYHQKLNLWQRIERKYKQVIEICPPSQKETKKRLLAESILIRVKIEALQYKSKFPN